MSKSMRTGPTALVFVGAILLAACTDRQGATEAPATGATASVKGPAVSNAQLQAAAAEAAEAAAVTAGDADAVSRKR